MNINNKNAIITFDYEVFLGRETGTIENCVIKPTQLILETLKENKAKAIFFVDATWLFVLKESFSEDFQIVAGQLKEISKSGSSIELHLHPQWINAYKKGDKIAFNTYEHYKLHSLNDTEIFDLFNKSIYLLENISNQKVRCFRAGGWCIEPFIKIKEAFETFKIIYDFSVAPGIYLKEGKVYDFDFFNAPRLSFYNFQNDVCKPEPTGCFIEIPLSTYQNNPVYRIVNKVLLMLNKDKIYGDGIGNKEKSICKNIIQVLRFSKGMFTLDKTSNLLFKYLLKTHLRSLPLIVIISHPKTFSRQAMNNLRYVSNKFNTLNSNDLDRFLVH